MIAEGFRIAGRDFCVLDPYAEYLRPLILH